MLMIINHYRLEPWQQNILSMIRDESIYYRPQGMTKVLNEVRQVIGIHISWQLAILRR